MIICILTTYCILRKQTFKRTPNERLLQPYLFNWRICENPTWSQIWGCLTGRKKCIKLAGRIEIRFKSYKNSWKINAAVADVRALLQGLIESQRSLAIKRNKAIWGCSNVHSLRRGSRYKLILCISKLIWWLQSTEDPIAVPHTRMLLILLSREMTRLCKNHCGTAELDVEPLAEDATSSTCPLSIC